MAFYNDQCCNLVSTSCNGNCDFFFRMNRKPIHILPYVLDPVSIDIYRSDLTSENGNFENNFEHQDIVSKSNSTSVR